MDRHERVLADIRSFVAERDWEQYHDPKNLAMALASEVGELVAELRWIAGEESDAFCADPENHDRIADEIADTAICLFMLADRVKLDLPARMHEKLVRIREKYPPDEDTQEESAEAGDTEPG
jgi:NTP pyrophosphatase (non-canonical NTP hydrolase)